jgi:hypothetical protein
MWGLRKSDEDTYDGMRSPLGSNDATHGGLSGLRVVNPTGFMINGILDGLAGCYLGRMKGSSVLVGERMGGQRAAGVARAAVSRRYCTGRAWDFV